MIKTVEEDENTKEEIELVLPDRGLITAELSKVFTNLFGCDCDITYLRQWTAVNSTHAAYVIYIDILKDFKSKRKLSNIILENGDVIKRRRTRSDKGKPRKSTEEPPVAKETPPPKPEKKKKPEKDKKVKPKKEKRKKKGK